MSNWTADDGTQISYEEYGNRSNRDVLLLLPGLLGSLSSQWRAFTKPLAADFHLVIMDLRGHGRSGNQSHALTPERMMQDISGLLDHLGITAVNIAGYDIGGYLGLLLAVNHPLLVRSLLMHGTKFYWKAEAVAKIRQQLDPENMAVNVPTYADQLVQEHGARNWRELVRHAADLIGLISQEGLTESMAARVSCPVVISLGDRDEMVPLPEAQRLSRVLPQGQLLVLPGVRHSFQSIRPIPLLPFMQYFHKTA